MKTDLLSIRSGPLVVIRAEASGQVNAQLVGLPELHATAATRDEALQRLQQLVADALTSGRLTVLQTPSENPLMGWFGYARDDPEFAAYVEEIRRQRQEIDASLAEMEDQGCSSSSSTPTT